MPVETRAQQTIHGSIFEVSAATGYSRVAAAEGSEDTASASSGAVVNRPERASQSVFWGEDEDWAEMAAVGEGKQRFSGRRNEGLTLEQFELQVEGSILDRFTKLQKDLGRPVEGAEFKKRFCVHLGEHMDNPAKEAHLRTYKECQTKEDPVKHLLASLRRHFGERNEGKAQEWVNFRREAGEELPKLLFRLQGLAGDLKKPLTDPELVTKFVAALDKRLGDAVNTQALAAVTSGDGGYTLDNAYDAAVRVSEMASRLRIAREMTPRLAEVVRPRWGGRAPAAHAAVPEAYPAAAATAVAAGSAGSGACHTCGEVGHYRNTCPQRNGGASGRGGPGRGAGRSGLGRGAGRPRICFVCGDPAHLSLQCPQRHVAPAAVAVPAGSRGGAELAAAGLNVEEVEEFLAWKAASQAAAALSLEDDDAASWDGEEYELGAAALRAEGDEGWRPTLLWELGAVATRAAAGARAGGEATQALRPQPKARKQARASTRPRHVVGPAIGQPVGTAALERKAPAEALRHLRARKDKAALKERMAKLPDQGREAEAQRGRPSGAAKSPGGASKTAAPDEATAPRAEEVRTGEAAVLLGQVTIDVGVFLGMAERAGLTLQQVVAMTGGGTSVPTPRVDPREVMRRVTATTGESGSPTLVPGRQVVTKETRGSGVPTESPGETVESGEPAVGTGKTGDTCPGEERLPRGDGPVRIGSPVSPGNSTDPESSQMAQERADRLARGQWQPVPEESDQQMALELLVEEARVAGVDSAAALRAQEGPVKGAVLPRRWETVGRRDKGKTKWGEADAAQGAGQAGAAVSDWAATHTLAAFAEALPKVPPTERSRWVGTPDWVDNRDGVVKVMTVAGLKAPLRVLIDGGSFYSMAGARLAAQLGLPVDSGGASCKVQTALGKVEPLGKGLTRDPVPIVLNVGTPAELTLYEPLAVTQSTGYDLLIGTRAAFPIGLSVDRWAERGTYRVDWRSQGEHVASIPMRLRQAVSARTPRGPASGKPVSTAGVALACSATQEPDGPGAAGSAPARAPREPDGLGVAGGAGRAQERVPRTADGGGAAGTGDGAGATGAAGQIRPGQNGIGRPVGQSQPAKEKGTGGPAAEKCRGWLVGSQLTLEEQGYAASVAEANRDVFANSLEEIGEFKLFEVELTLKSDKPIFERRRKHSVKEWELIDQRCAELEAAGIIEETDSDFAANSVLAAKKDPEGNWKLDRFCTDLRRVNLETAQDRYPMPLPEEVLEALGHAKFYSTIDIRGAFHQLVVKKEDRRKLAFWGSTKLYCWKRCPFGARNPSAWFQRAIDRTLRGLEAFWELHRRRAGGWRGDAGGAYGAGAAGLGSAEGGKVSPVVAKVAAIEALPRPTDVTSVKAFNGVVNYYRRFIPECSRVQGPLNDLTKKEVQWRWGEEQEGAFLALKKALQNEPVLALPVRGRKFKVRCDWSKKGVGGVLLQADEQGVDRVIAYGSRSCNPAESRYSSFEGELLAAVYFVRLWRNYLYGEQFTLESDHRPLKWILTNTKLTGKLARWAMMLSEFDMEVDHTPGEENEMDCLSRYPQQSDEDTAGVRQEGDLGEVLAPCWSAAAALAWAPTDSPGQDGSRRVVARPAVDVWEDAAVLSLLRTGRVSAEATVWAAAGGAPGARAQAPGGAPARDAPGGVAAVRAPGARALAPGGDAGGGAPRVRAQAPDGAAAGGVPGGVAAGGAPGACAPAPGGAATRAVPGLRAPAPGGAAAGGAPGARQLAPGVIAAGRAQAGCSPGERDRVQHRARSFEWRRDHLVHRGANGEVRVVPRPAEREALIRDVHEKCGHFGVKKTGSLLSPHYWWVGLAADVQRVVRRCEACDRVRAAFNAVNPVLQPLPIKGLFYRWGLDFAGPLPKSSRGNQFVLVMVEHFSKHVVFVPTADKEAQTVAEAFTREVLTTFGACAEIVTDRGGEFGGVFQELLDRSHIDHRSTSSHHPQANGLSERIVGVVKGALRKWCLGHAAEQWDVYLPWVAMGYRFSAQASLGGFSPYMLLFGREPVLPGTVCAALEEPLDLDRPDRLRALVAERAALFRKWVPMAMGNLQIAQHRDTLRYAKTRSGAWKPQILRYAVGD
ncbi:hypothetical protein KFL_001690230, partial [Klebsormidium nitens]